jgi:chemotaxis protein CheD
MSSEHDCSNPSYFDREFGVEAVKILPGEFYASADGTAITTLLGSCVSVCLFDPLNGVGGMNHFMLPQILIKSDSGATRCSDPAAVACAASCSARYGACAMRHLLQRLKELGASESRLEAKLFGAGHVMAGMTDIGAKNASFALGYLQERGIPVVASDLGEHYPRKIFFFPATGRVAVKRIRDLPAGIP